MAHSFQPASWDRRNGSPACSQLRAEPGSLGLVRAQAGQETVLHRGGVRCLLHAVRVRLPCANDSTRRNPWNQRLIPQ